MALNGPIILVEDDTNDTDVICEAIEQIGIPNPIKKFATANEAHNYLLHTQEQPFIILCDIRMPSVDGLSFRRNIFNNEFLRKKSIPFVFYTGMVSQEIINEAYDMEVQGFYEKASSFIGIKEQLLTLFLYWKNCLHPNRAIEV